MKNLGLILLIGGIIMTTFTGFNVITEEKVIDFGSVEIRAEKKIPIYWSPITGGLLAVAGALILIVGKKRI